MGTDEEPLKVEFSSEGKIKGVKKIPVAEIRVWRETKGAIYDQLSDQENSEARYSKYFSNYTQVRKVFNYLKDQSCNDYYTPEVYPCIPFQFKLDGCYARAHKMKDAMENEFGKTCDKIFVYGWLKNGCGSGWRYHVAPVVYVGSTKYVIDPSLRNYPLSVSSWKNKMSAG